jgi:hypothetical protein
MTNMTGSKLSIFSHPGKITGYWQSANFGDFTISSVYTGFQFKYSRFDLDRFHCILLFRMISISKWNIFSHLSLKILMTYQ